MKRWIKWIFGGCAILTLAAIIFGKLYFGSAQELEKWIGRQIVAIVNTFLVPQLSYADLEYTPPYAVSMQKVALTAPDGTKVLELEGFGLALAETPGMDRPVVIQNVEIDHGRINLIRDSKTGGIRGFSPIVKSSDVAAPIRAESESAEVKEFRLSDLLQLRLIDLHDVGLRYEPGGDQPPILIDGITTQLKIDSAEAAGWYKLDLAVDRGPNMHLVLRGRINLDTRIAELEEGRIAIRVTPDSISSLPSELQAILKRYDARGELDLRVSGRIPLSNPADSKVSVHVELKSFRLALGQRLLTVESLVMDAAIEKRKVELSSLNGSVLKGKVFAQAHIDVGQVDMPISFNWNVKDLDIAEWRQEAGESNESLKGLVSSTGAARATLAALPASLSGSGELHLREGRLMGLPLISALVELMKIKIPAWLSPADKADVTFKFTPSGLRIERMDIITALIAAHGDGMVMYDATLDLRLNAGPLEKLQSLLGKAGDLLALMTDRLVAYKVEGKVGSPKVRLMVLEQKLGR